MARAEIATADGRVCEVRVLLSRRNLLALLAKLETPGSRRTIINNDCWLDGQLAPPELLLVLTAEDDADHYGRRPAPPGPMHPTTERLIARHGGWTPRKENDDQH